MNKIVQSPKMCWPIDDRMEDKSPTADVLLISLSSSHLPSPITHSLTQTRLFSTEGVNICHLPTFPIIWLISMRGVYNGGRQLYRRRCGGFNLSVGRFRRSDLRVVVHRSVHHLLPHGCLGGEHLLNVSTSYDILRLSNN